MTIGAEKRQSPILGDNVFIGAGAKIIGPVRIGDGAKIGANAVVLADFPPGATTVGIPARVVGEQQPHPVDRKTTDAEKPENQAIAL